jgi:hypothetical protein
MVEYVRQYTFLSRTPPEAGTPWTTPYTDYYSYKAYSWDNGNHVAGGFSQGTLVVPALNVAKDVYVTDSPSPPELYRRRYEVIDTFQKAVYNPVSNTSPVKTVRVHHAGLADRTNAGMGLTFLETHNPLKIDFDATRDVTKIGLNGTAGAFRLHVRPQDDQTPLETSYTVPGLSAPLVGLVLRASLHLQGSTDPLTWVTLTLTPNQNGLDAYYPFAVTTPGTYDYQVRPYFNDPAEPDADWSRYYDPTQTLLKGSVTVAKVQAVVATMEFVTPIASQPTGHRLAAGILMPQVRATGAGALTITMQLTQDGLDLDIPHNAVQVGTSNIYQATFTGLPAGFYTVKAQLLNTTTVLEREADGQVAPPPLEIGDQLSFLPWVLPQLTNDALLLAAAAPSGQASARPQVPLSATLTTNRDLPGRRVETLARTTAQIAGPGDVQGLAKRAILHTWPAPGATSCSPLELAFIDFQDEDLPWRYSTLHTPVTAGHPTPEPLPWLMLLVLKDDGLEYQRQAQSGALPSILVKGGRPGTYPSPDPAQQQLWAHVQVNASFGQVTTPATQPSEQAIKDFVSEQLPKSPDLANSRIFSARRLAENTEYHAFLVPAVEAGRLAGLGLDFAPADATKSALPTGTADCAFPVYFQWKFSTGIDEDFETLAGRLAPASTAAAAAPTLAVGVGSHTYQLPMPGLLHDAASPPPQLTAAQASDQLRVAQHLYDQVVPLRPAGGRPVVAAPLYGRAYAMGPTLDAPTGALPANWKHQLNLDPRYRALAALGAEVVRDNQEEYVRRAWEQVQDILLANEKLRGAQYGLRTTAGLRHQHLPLTTTTASPGGQGVMRLAWRATESDAATTTEAFAKDAASTSATAAPTTGLADYGLHLTAGAMRRTRLSPATVAATALPVTTVREALRRSDTPLAAFSPTFRRVMKPFGKYQVGAAGRPLRPTQPAPEADPTDLLQPGTSLRQRDTVLSRLVAGTLTAAPAPAEQVRLYQFDDGLIDGFLGRLGVALPVPPPLAGKGDAPARFQAAFTSFRAVGTPRPDGSQQVVGFRVPQYVRPSLPLDLLKQDMLAATDPGPAFEVKIKTVVPAMGALPPVSQGDFEGPDFNASHFYVGDYNEPSHVTGDWLLADFASADFLVGREVFDYETAPEIIAADPTPTLRAAPLASPDDAAATAPTDAAPAGRSAPASFLRRSTRTASRPAASAAAPPTDASIPVIKQAKVFPVFKEAMGEALRQRHPELFVPGLGSFPTNGVAVLDVNPAFIEAYMVGLNHALGSELLWRGFPVDLRATFFQQFWDVSEHFNMSLPVSGTGPDAPTGVQEATMLDIKPLDQWVSTPLGGNSLVPSGASGGVLRLALRSELLARYPTLVLALQDNTLAASGTDGTDPAHLRYPLQRLTVGQDLAVVTFGVDPAYAEAHCALVLMERPGQPKFGLDAEPSDPAHPLANPLSWNDFTWDYAGTAVDAQFVPTTTGQPGTKPHATAEPDSVAYLTDSATVAYALLQEPILATIPLSAIL